MEVDQFSPGLSREYLIKVKNIFSKFLDPNIKKNDIS